MIYYVDIPTNTFSDSNQTIYASFKEDIFSSIYALKITQQLLTQDFIKAFAQKYEHDVLIKTWMEDPNNFILKPNRKYPICVLRLPYNLLEVMLCRFYGVDNCSYFEIEWDPLAHHITTTGQVFNWAHIFLITLQDALAQEQNSLATRNPKFYLSAYLMNIMCTSFAYHSMDWNWTREKPPIHIYCSILQEYNYMALYL